MINLARIKQFGIFTVVVLLLLCVRLGYLSAIKGEALSKQAVLQRTDSIPIKTARGIIYDRQMRAITEGRCRLHAAVIVQECVNPDEVSRLIGQKITKDDIEIFPLQAVTEQQARLVKMRGVMLFNVSERYNQDGLLSHVIGYKSDDGGFGIEYAFDKELTIEQSDSISMIKNANSKMMTGLGYNRTSKKNYNGIRLSIDYHVQAIVEKALDNNMENGAAVVVEVETGDILAMASRPNFLQSQLAKYLTSSRGELINRAVSEYDLGSVFKVVLAAAALEEGIYNPQSQFRCGGALDVSGREFVCNNKDGHGVLSLELGLAHSCNVVFYKIGQDLGINKINEYAKKLGFDQKILNIEGFGEKKGYIPSDIENMPQEIANISIGQGKIKVTPLQVADMFCTIANGGIRKSLTLTDGIVDQNGNYTQTKTKGTKRVISAQTAAALRKMLRTAVKEGTGTNAQIEGWGAAGKTGSAQSGWEKDGELMTHGRFGGYFPEENPKYVCVVLAENGKSGAASAAPVFREIGEGIKKLYPEA